MAGKNALIGGNRIQGSYTPSSVVETLLTQLSSRSPRARRGGRSPRPMRVVVRSRWQAQSLALLLLAAWGVRARRSAAAPSLECEPQASGWYGIGRNWEDMNALVGAPWGTRTGFGFAVIGGRLALFGGEESEGLQNDVFVSTDASAWTRLHSKSEWSPRTNFQHVMHDNAIYVMSGRGCATERCESGACYCNDIWRAPTPAANAIYQLNFEKVGLMAHSGRERGLALSFEGRIYDIGGCSQSGCFVDIRVLDGEIWRAVDVNEPECQREDRRCFWTDQYVGAWPATDEYRLVGAAHEDALYIFGGNIICTVLQLRPSSAGPTQMNLYKKSTVGNTHEVKRAYALSFYSMLWLATGLEDNGEGRNNLFYSETGVSWERQQELIFFSGRLHGGVIFRNRMCLFLGDHIGTASSFRWKVACSVKPSFPQPYLSYGASETIQEEAAFVLRSPAVLSFSHADVPEGVPFQVIYYAGHYSPQDFPDYYDITKTHDPEDARCSRALDFQKRPMAPTTLYFNVRVEFDDNQAFKTAVREEVWTIKETLTAPQASATFMKKNGGGEQESHHITVWCSPGEECGSYGLDAPTTTPNCQVAYRYSADAAVDTCPAPCDVNIQDMQYSATMGLLPGYVPRLFRVQAQCRHKTGDWIASAFRWFEPPVLTAPIVIAGSTPAPGQTVTADPSATMPPFTTTPPPQLNILEWRICCPFLTLSQCRSGQPCDHLREHPSGYASTEEETWLVMQGTHMDLVDKIQVGPRECEDLSLGDTSLVCRIPAGIGSEDLRLWWRDGTAMKYKVLVDAVRYPEPELSHIIAGLSPTEGGNLVTVIGSRLGGGVLGGFSTDEVSPWLISHFQAAASIGFSKAAGVNWQSDSSLTLRTPPGVGTNHRLLLSIHGTSIPPPRYTLSYVAPVLTALKPSIGPSEGGITVTLFGQSFGYDCHEGSKAAIDPSECSSTIWRSDSSIICVSPKGKSGIDLPVTIAVGGQLGVMQGGYQYTTGSDPVVFFMSASPQELKEPAAGGPSLCSIFISRLDCFVKWLTVTLGLREESQIYIEGVDAYDVINIRSAQVLRGGTVPVAVPPLSHALTDRTLSKARSFVQPPSNTMAWQNADTGEATRQKGAQAKLALRFFGSPKDANRAIDTVLRDLEFLATSKAAFADSGLEVEALQLRPDEEVISVAGTSGSGRNTTHTSNEADEQGASGNMNMAELGAVVAIALTLCGAAAFWFCRTRALCRQHLDDAIEITSTPNRTQIGVMPDDSSLGAAGSNRGSSRFGPSAPSLSQSRVSLHAESVFSPTPSPKASKLLRMTSQGRCVQCENSGFAVCVHRSMGLLGEETDPGEAGSSSDDDEDTLCVVCLHGVREAIVVHADAAKTSHQVLCLACAYRILEQGGSCPVCRKTIFAVFKAK